MHRGGIEYFRFCFISFGIVGYLKRQHQSAINGCSDCIELAERWIVDCEALHKGIIL